MRLLVLTAAFAIAGCRSEAPPEQVDGPSVADLQEGSEAVDTAQDTAADDGECDEEGEACVDYEDGLSSCCLSRQTCFPQGCYYTDPG